MPGGIHPPIEVILSWPTPNYINPVTRPMVSTIIACVFGPITLFFIFARLWVRLRIQRSGDLDDWLMIAAIIPIIALTVIMPLSADKYQFNKHVWDVKPSFYVIQRKFILAVEVIFCVAAGLVKVSILLFYRRLSARSVSVAFRRITWGTIAFIAAYSIAFTIVPIFGCKPVSAFWDQSDIVKASAGYKYTCFNEGADVVAAGIISTVQDLITALLPTFLYWNLQIPIRQKVALFGIFAIGYGVVALGILRTIASWRIFFETYDVTWVVWESWNYTLLEIHVGALCANAPALKVFFKQYLRIKSSNGGSGSPSRSNGSKPKPSENSNSTTSTSTSKYTFWKASPSKDGYLSEPHTSVCIDQHGGVQVQRDVDICISEDFGSEDDIARCYSSPDIEMGEVFKALPDATTSPSCEDLHALPAMPTPSPAVDVDVKYPARTLSKERVGLSLFPKKSEDLGEARPAWQTW